MRVVGPGIRNKDFCFHAFSIRTIYTVLLEVFRPIVVGAKAGLCSDEPQRSLTQNRGFGLLHGRHLINARLGHETGGQRVKRALGKHTLVLLRNHVLGACSKVLHAHCLDDGPHGGPGK